MPIEQLQNQVNEWIKKYGVRYFNELTNMAILAEEVGEVARIISRKYGEQSFKENDNTDLGEELADVLFVVLCLANQTNINLQDASGSYAYHIPEGILLHYIPSQKINLDINRPWRSVSALDFTPSILEKFGLQIPSYMQKENLFLSKS